MQRAKIVLLAVVAATVYGVVHDQITVRLCAEYFTIAHAPLFPTDSLTLLGLYWGVAATFWVGLMLGLLLALVSQSAGAPPVPTKRLCRSMVALLIAMAVCAALAGLLGFVLSQRALVHVPHTLADLIRPARHARFMAVWFAHGASYLVGMAGGGWVIVRIWRERGRPHVLPLFPRTKAAVLRALLLLAIVALIVWLRFGRP